MSDKTNIHTTRHRSRGFTLLEVLIALVILSIGLLGIAGLQSVGLRSSHGSYLTSQASLLAYDIADRIRANAGGFSGKIAQGTTLVSSCPETVADTPLVEADLQAWGCSVEELLPSGAAQIERTANGILSRYTIQISWEDLQVENDQRWTFELAIDL